MYLRMVGLCSRSKGETQGPTMEERTKKSPYIPLVLYSARNTTVRRERCPCGVT
jgi:hypothetical protein